MASRVTVLGAAVDSGTIPKAEMSIRYYMSKFSISLCIKCRVYGGKKFHVPEGGMM